MTDITDVLVKIKVDLDWRGPNDKILNYVELSREHGEYLYRWAINLIQVKDEMEKRLDRCLAVLEPMRTETLR